MKTFLRITAYLFLVLSLASLAVADDGDEIQAAYEAGDFQQVIKYTLVRAENGEVLAQHNLGYLYFNGKGTPADYEEALKWYRKAADQGFADSQYALGDMFYFGQGTVQDYREAANWYRLAAEQGHPQAQFNLGTLYVQGLGVMQSYEDAYAWWMVAAANGNESARVNMEIAHSGEMTPAQITRGQQIAKEIWERLGK